ncbi:MAG: M48 family metallopeptidase [Caldilineaceae bacterium]|nr:M48 family metallopeptidase [Caldilineaceae bacterium]
MTRQNTPSRNEQLQYGDQLISYSVTYAKRKTLGITVRADLSVNVRAPLESDLASVAEIVLKHAPWILRQQQNFAERPPKQPPRRAEAEAIYRYLGRDLRLKVMKLADNQPLPEQIKVDKDILRVWVKDPQDKKRVESLIEKWYRQQAEIVFLRRLLTQFPRFKQYPIHLPELAIRRMKARWGSCGTNGKITLNLKLIHEDEALIDYVIIHELCHLIEHNHSKHFYALLDRILPDWRARRQRLNETAANHETE